MTVNSDYPFIVREEIDEHMSYIRNIEKAKRATNVKSALGLVFSHQKAVFDELSCPLIDNNTKCCGFSLNIESCQYERALKFYNDYYCSPSLRVGISKTGNPYPLINFINRITSFSNLNANKITFLLGEVGWGKTAFLNYLLTNYGKDWFLDKSIFFVRVDAHSGGGGSISTYNQLIDKIMKKIRKVLVFPDVEEKINSRTTSFTGFDKLIDYRNPTGQKEKEIASVLFELKALGFEILLVFDNLDQIYHRDDRARFVNDIPVWHDSFKPVGKIITSFFHDNIEFGGLGANVIFSIRTETYDILSQTVEYIFSPDRVTTQNMNAFTLDNVDWREVVEKRLEFLKEISEKCKISKGNSSDIDEVINPIKYEIIATKQKESKHLVSNLSKVTSFGLRCIIDFFSQYSWINNKTNVIQRYFDQYHVGLLAYMLAGHRRYSQRRAKFPNLYSVNSNLIEHPPTYWLKRLLVEFIFKNQSLLQNDERP
jgi:hypothetical protein